MKKNGIKIVPGVLALALDQITKAWVRGNLMENDPMTVIDGILALRYAENTGAAFSFLSAYPQLLTVFTAVLIAAVCVWLAKDKSLNRLCYLGLSLIAGGGVGNLIDRTAFGYVTDFIEVLFVQFAVFNIADCAICIGAFLCMISLLRKEQPS